jgi:hypothetical protein
MDNTGPVWSVVRTILKYAEWFALQGRWLCRQSWLSLVVVEEPGEDSCTMYIYSYLHSDFSWCGRTVEDSCTYAVVSYFSWCGRAVEDSCTDSQRGIWPLYASTS